MADNNKVTIDAAYFNHLFTRTVECERLRTDREGLILENERIAKERDGLKAKLDAVTRPNNLIIDNCEKSCAVAKRLAAAERCIGEIDAIMENGIILDAADGEKIVSAIRAYREQKEAK